MSIAVALPLYWENVDFFSIASVVLYILLGGTALACAVLWVLFAVKKSPKIFSAANIVSLLLVGITVALSLVLIDHWGETIKFKDDNDVSHRPWYWHFTKYAVIATGAAIAAVFLRLSKTEKTRSTQELTFGAVSIAASFALSYIGLFKMPMGGTVTLASVLPLAIYCFYYGVKKGLLASFVYSLLQLLQEPIIYAFGQVLLDYILPFTAIALVGVFSYKNKKLGKWGIFLGLLIYSAVRYFCHFLSGALYFGIFMPSQWDNVWIYSLAYNSIVFIDTLIAAGFGLALTATDYFPRFMERYVAKGESARARLDARRPVAAADALSAACADGRDSVFALCDSVHTGASGAAEAEETVDSGALDSGSEEHVTVGEYPSAAERS